MHTRLEKQLAFVREIDRLKGVLRRNLLMDGSRLENSAEHSWHLALSAVVMAEYAADDVDLLRVVKMALVHDLVEIDAGDTFCYDSAGNLDKPQREARAAERIFGIPPSEQGAELRALWEEFDARQTPEAKFANSLDRLQPLLHNYHNAGAAWRKHKVTYEQAMERNRHIAEGSPELWEYAKGILADAAERGWLIRS